MMSNTKTTRILNDTEIEKLYTFTSKHYIPYYDLQTELVDHLANAIEAQWMENPAIPFEEALQLEFKKFGIFGFTGILEQRQATLSKYYRNRIIWEMISFFKFPKIVLTLALIFTVFRTLHNSSYNNYIVFALLVMMFSIEVVSAYKWNRKIKKQQKETGKKWLLEEVIRGVYVIFPALLMGNIINILYRIIENGMLGFWNVLLFSTVIVLLSFLQFIRIVKMPLLFEEEISKTVKRHRFVK